MMSSEELKANQGWHQQLMFQEREMLLPSPNAGHSNNVDVKLDVMFVIIQQIPIRAATGSCNKRLKQRVAMVAPSGLKFEFHSMLNQKKQYCQGRGGINLAG